MSFLKRLFSADYRAAVSAEAAGQYEQAAERYALAGEPAAAARAHMARAARASDRAERIDALRDALHWAASDPALLRDINKRLGLTLLDRAQAEGVATERDKKRLREAAEVLVAGGAYAEAGEALLSIGAYAAAAKAFRDGGLVDRMEEALAAEDERTAKARTLRESFANYEMHMRIGERDAAREDLRRCIEVAEKSPEYRRLLDELSSRLITGGRVVLRRRHGDDVIASAVATVMLGRDALCELPLRSAGISRQHAAIAVAADPPGFSLRDAGSRNGTLIGGMPVSGAVPLAGEGAFALGDHCTVGYRVDGDPPRLRLHIEDGMDRGLVLITSASPAAALDLSDEGLPVKVAFRDGRPHLGPASEQISITLDGELVAHGSVQLVRGDAVIVRGPAGSEEIDVE